MSDTDTGGARRPGTSDRVTTGSRSGTPDVRPAVTPQHDPSRRMSARETLALDDELRAGQPGAGTRPADLTKDHLTVADEAVPSITGRDAPVDEPPSTTNQPGRVRLGDRIFQGLSTASGVLIVAIIAAVAVFLIWKAIPALSADQVNFLFSREWSVNGTDLRFGVLDLLWVTVISSVIAMVVALPVGVGIALFITHYSPKPLAGPLARTIDLLAAIPSIVYGVWGLLVFGPAIQPVASFLQTVLGTWIPLFADRGIATRTIFTAGIVLAIMILPIITAVSRDVFERTPRANIEASLALGATRWEMIRMSVIPYGKAGVVSGAMLGLGRALGETIAVTLILATLGNGAPFVSSIFSGGDTFASKIARNASEFSQPTQTGAYIAAGLVLFVLTFVVNAAARVVVGRGGK